MFCSSSVGRHGGGAPASEWLVLAIQYVNPVAATCFAATRGGAISFDKQRSLSRLIAAGKIFARKESSRTLVDVELLKACYAGLADQAIKPVERAQKKKALRFPAGPRDRSCC